MSTQFEEVYDSFLLKVEDYSYLKLTQEDLYSHLKKLLYISCAKFRNCKKDLSDRSELGNEFNINLSEIEKEILASLMVVEHLKPEITTSNLIKQSMSDKDFKIYSQANHLDSLKELYKHVKDEANKMMNAYSFYSNSLDDLK